MGSFIAALKSVAWAILGVRKAKDRERDFQNISVVHIAVAATIGLVLFIVVLMLVVRWVVPN